MKNFKRVMSVVLTVMLLATGLIAALPVSAAPTNYLFNLGLDNIKDEYYEFMAYDIANNELHPLETESRPTWSPNWPGHFVVGQNYNAICKPENGKYIIDLIPRTQDQFVPAVVFTAPADGKYNVVVELFKLYASKENATTFVDVMLIKGSTGEVLLKDERLEQGELNWVKKNVELAEGEKVFIIVVLCADSTQKGGHNVALKSLLVNESVQQSSTPMATTSPDNTADDTTAPDNGKGNDEAPDEFNPIIIVAIAGGVLVVAAIVVVVAVKAKKKK